MWIGPWVLARVPNRCVWSYGKWIRSTGDFFTSIKCRPTSKAQGSLIQSTGSLEVGSFWHIALKSSVAFSRGVTVKYTLLRTRQAFVQFFFLFLDIQYTILFKITSPFVEQCVHCCHLALARRRVPLGLTTSSSWVQVAATAGCHGRDLCHVSKNLARFLALASCPLGDGWFTWST